MEGTTVAGAKDGEAVAALLDAQDQRTPADSVFSHTVHDGDVDAEMLRHTREQILTGMAGMFSDDLVGRPPVTHYVADIDAPLDRPLVVPQWPLPVRPRLLLRFLLR